MNEKLEARYRRLLSWYPWEHRRMYEEEMLGVLMAGARPGQRYPRLADAANLLASAAWRRLGLAARDLGGADWRDAAAIVGLLGAMVLAGLRLHPYSRVVSGRLFGAEPGLIDWPQAAPRLALWLLATAAALAGLRLAAAVLAWAGAGCEVLLAGLRYPDEPVSAISAMWPLVLAVVTAAALTAPAARRRAVTVLGARRLVPLGLGVVVAGAAPIGGRLVGGGLHGDIVMVGSFTMFASRLMHLIGGVLIAAVVWRLAAPIRRRVLALLAPVIAAQATVEMWFDGWAHSTWQWGHSIPLVPAQWAALLLVPLFTFAASVAMVRRRDERARLLALARTTDRTTSA